VSRVYRATIQCVDSGILVYPSFHYQTDLTAVQSEPDPSDVAAGIWGHIGTAFTACCPSRLTINQLVVTEQTVPPALGVAGDHTIATAGTLASSGTDTMPTGLCPILNLHSNTRSRSARGWTFMPTPLYSA